MKIFNSMAASAVCFFAAFAAIAQPKPVPAKMEISSESSEFKNLQVTVEVYDTVYYWERLPESFDDFSCDEYGDSSMREGRIDFFDRAGSLSQAIVGLNRDQAKVITDNPKSFLEPWFEPFPTSWNDFKSVIEILEERHEELLGIYQTVIVQGGRANVVNLGYEGFEDGNCGWNFVTRPVYKAVPHEEVVDSETTDIDVYVENSVFLPGETETIYALFDGKKISFDDSQSLNKYLVETRPGERGVYYLMGQGRSARPDLGDFQLRLSQSGAELSFYVSDSKASILDGYQLSMSFNLMQKKSCGGDKTVLTKTMTVTSGDTVDLTSLVPGGLVSGKTYYLSGVSFTRNNTAFFQGSSATTDSNEVKYQ